MHRELLCALGLGSQDKLYSDNPPFEICRHKIRPQIKYLEIQKMHPLSSTSSTWAFRKEGRSCFVFFPGKVGDGWDECQKLPFGMSQEIGMGRFALIPAWTHAKEDFQNSQPVISCHRVKKSYSLFFHSKACNQKPAEIILGRFVWSVNMFLKSWIQMTKFKKNQTNNRKTSDRANPLTENLFPPPRWIKKHCYEIPVQILLWAKSKCFGVFGIQIWSSSFQPICSIWK